MGNFSKIRSPEYSDEGIANFKDFVLDDQILDKVEFFGAFLEKVLVGIIAARDNRSHVTAFFVDEKYQNKGIGKAFWLYLKAHSTAAIFTVNSSPYAVPSYHQLGFEDTAGEQSMDGIIFTPMAYIR